MMKLTLSTVLALFESNPSRLFTFDSLCAEHCISGDSEKQELGEIVETLLYFNLISATPAKNAADTRPITLFQFSGKKAKSKKPPKEKQERSIADFAKGLEELKANLASNRDKLRDYISEANAFVEDIDEEIDLLDQCADLMSRYV